MLGFGLDYNEEYMLHRQLSLGILYMAPFVVLALIGFRPPTYGKHVTVNKAKQVASTDASDKKESASAPSDAASNGKASSDSTSCLRQRRGLKDSENTSKNGNDNTSIKQQQQKQKKHWLGPLLPAKWSWVFFESPCWIWVVVCLWDFYFGKEESEERQSLPVRNIILLGWFSFHYIYRSLWYPLVMMKSPEHKSGKKATAGGMPLGIVFFAWSYCCVNGYLQARGLTKFSIPVFAADEESMSSSMVEYQFWFGILLTFVGFYITISSDRILQKLKQEKQRKAALRQSQESKNGSGGSRSSHYAVPYGGMFKYVSSPHYFGEMMEWAGFCIANNFSLASLSFVVWTAANLVPRAIHTHKWYIETFVGNGDKSKDNARDSDAKTERDEDCDESTNYSELNRKAVIPFIL